MGSFDLYIHVMLILMLLSLLVIRKSVSTIRVIDVPPYTLSFVFLAFAVYCMASMPIPWGTWADRHGYAHNFMLIQRGIGESVYGYSDVGFAYWMKLTSKLVDYKGWFYLTAIVYVGNYLWAAWRFTKEYSYVLFLMMLCCFQFYAYGTNTIRAGMAGSFIILGLSFCNDIKKMAFCLAVGLSIHNSMIIPIAAIILAWNIRKTNLYILGWFACILISLIVGETLQQRVAFLVEDARTNYLTSGQDWQKYNVGFRWDFLFYSALPVLLGYYYIYKLKYRNDFYEFLYRMYLTANGFWVLVIRANFTDRFAYLSWFLFPILLSYPLLSKQLYADAEYQSRNLKLVMIGEFGFTFLLFLLYGGRFFGVKVL